MLRPNFVRSQIGDVATFEKHVSHLISRLPTDGSTVNLADFFFRLTMDSATEFLFAKDVEFFKDFKDYGDANPGQVPLKLASASGDVAVIVNDT